MKFNKTADDFEIGEQIQLYNWKDAHAVAVKCDDVLTGDIDSNIYGIMKREWLRLRKYKLKVLGSGINKSTITVQRLTGFGVYYVPAYLAYKVKENKYDL